MRTLVVALLVLALGAAACGGSDPTPTAEPTPASTPAAATSTSGPEASATPQNPDSTATLVPAVPPTRPAPSAQLVEAFPGLTLPNRGLELHQVPGTELMVTLFQDGYLVTFPKEGPYDSPNFVLDITNETADGNELGLLSMAFDPGFPGRGFVYLYYSRRAPNLQTAIIRFAARVVDGDLVVDEDDRLTILVVDQPHSNHNGGTLVFGPDGMLYLGLGDGGSAGDPDRYGQDTSQNLLGTVIRIDVRDSDAVSRYVIPAGNPFVDDPAVLNETWAYGLRNPWRMSFDADTGDLWAGDVGQNMYEEVDIIRPGANLGWDIMEGPTCFEPRVDCDMTGLTVPLASYGRDLGRTVIGGYVYRGTEVRGLVGQYVYGDIFSGNVWVLDAAAAAAGGRPQPVLLWEGGPGMFSFAVDTENELYLLGADNTIYKFAP